MGSHNKPQCIYRRKVLSPENTSDVPEADTVPLQYSLPYGHVRRVAVGLCKTRTATD